MRWGSLAERWTTHLVTPVPQPVMALCRTVFGATLLFRYLYVGLHFDFLLGVEGLGGAGFYARYPGPPISRTWLHNFHLLQAVQSDGLAWLLYLGLVICAGACVVGFRSRLACALTAVLHLVFHARAEFAFWGWADIVTPLLIYVALSPAAAAHGLDGWLLRRRGQPAPSSRGPRWPLLLMQVHVATLYFVVAYARLDNPAWLDGDMVYRILANGLFSRFTYAWDGLRTVWWVLGTGAWVIELLAPFALFVRRLRMPWVWALLAMHLGLEALTLVGGWNIIMAAALVSFFPEGGASVVAAARRLLGKIGDTAQSAPSSAGAT